MKKIIAVALAGLLATAVLPGLASAERLYPKGDDNHVNVYVNGTLLTLDQPALVKNDRTLVPFRAVLEALGAQVGWNEDTQTVTAAKGGTKIQLSLGSTTAAVNGQSVKLDVPAESINYRTMVPLRFMAESLGAKIGWAGTTSSAFVSTYQADSLITTAQYVLDVGEQMVDFEKACADSDTIFINYINKKISYTEFTSAYWKNRDEVQAQYDKIIAVPAPDDAFARHYSERTKAYMTHTIDFINLRGSAFKTDGSVDIATSKKLIGLMDELLGDSESYNQEFVSTTN